MALFKQANSTYAPQTCRAALSRPQAQALLITSRVGAEVGKSVKMWDGKVYTGCQKVTRLSLLKTKILHHVKRLENQQLERYNECACADCRSLHTNPGPKQQNERLNSNIRNTEEAV